jgi:hypothetical protein
MIPALAVGLAFTLAFQSAAADRSELTRALERLVETGEPRHVDHDEGAELQAAVTRALAGDTDVPLRWLATRAAFPIVVRIGRPLSTIETAGFLDVRARQVLKLPWPVGYEAQIEGQADGGDWKPLLRIRSGAEETPRLDSMLPPRGVSSGFHTLQLRAQIRYDGLPSGMPRTETRRLPPIYYGLWNPRRLTARGAAVAAFVDRGKTASVRSLAPEMPNVPLTNWLAQVMRTETGQLWRTDPCTLHAHPSGESPSSADVCAVGLAQGPDGTMAEVWVKIAELRPDEAGGPWFPTEPGVVGSYLRRSGRAPVPLALMPALVDAPEESWPTPVLVVHAGDIDVAPAVPVPGEPSAVRVFVENQGAAPAYGVQIDILTGSDEQSTIRRSFIRDVAAGEHAEIAFTTQYSRPYGWVIAHVMMLTEHADSWVAADPPLGNEVAIRFLNPAAAPPDFVASICRSAVARADCAR